MFCVYIIESKKRNYRYVGLTNNLQRRLEEHQKGYNKITKFYCPFELIYSELFDTRPQARRREKYLKSGYGRQWIKNQVKN